MSGTTDPVPGWNELFDLTGGDSDMQQTLQAVVQYAKRRLPGTDEAAITLIRRGTAATIATTGGMAEVLDELQYEAGYGPCLDAGRSNEILHIPDAATETRWPRYLPPARDNGLASSLSLPIPVENYLVGALNLYSRTPDAFNEESVQLGDAMAAHICAALSRAEAIFSYRNQVEQLHRAMESRAVIEQAKGMVMVQRRCSAVEAFTELRTMSMNQNIKLAELAAAIVSAASGHPVRFDDDGQ
jgi:GAF domain-containing protein